MSKQDTRQKGKLAHPEWLTDTEALAAALDDPELRILDCTVHLIPDPETTYRIKSGREDYENAHIPGADFIDLDAELSDRSQKLRFMMPSPEQFAEAMGRHGVGDDARVVLYSTTHIMWATRVWWMLRAMGFDNAAVLDGGFQKWQAEGRPVSSEPAAYAPATFTPKPRPDLFADKDEVRRAIGDGKTCILNALMHGQHTGESKFHYGRPGRIAGSVNVPAFDIVDENTGQLISPDALAAKFRDVGADDAERVIAYCGGGIAATADAFALSLLGREDVAVYDASMSEWANDAAMPMETG